MTNQDFYDIIDSEIDSIISRYDSDQELKKKDENGKKSYAFLLWFLENNLIKNTSDIESYKQFIVDGNDDNSCDLIFDNKENEETVYYVIQAKWFSKSNCEKTNDTSNIYKACLTDFNMILQHTKAESPTNTKFNTMYRKFKNHVSSNGKVRFLLVALCTAKPGFRLEELNEYINNEPLVTTKIYDLISLKNTYIDCKHRGYITDNPLAPLDPINKKITVNIFNHLIIENNSSYIFIVTAKEIFRLYENFGTRLFLKNVRNPITVSINEKMKDSARKEPDNFFSYNNGITAITNGVYDFYPNAKNISVNGLQIINGAQTVKSLANAYRDASPSERRKMNKELKLTMKVIIATNTSYERNIIKFTVKDLFGCH